MDDMKKVWQQGFRHQKTELQQHEINSIMKRKSEDIIEKIKRTLKKDQKAYPFVATLVVLPLLFFGHYYFAIFMVVVFAALYFLNMKMIKKLYAIEIKDSTLQYLLSIRSLFRYANVYYTRLLGIGMPLVAIPFILFVLELSGIGLEHFFSYQDPWHGVGILLGLAVVFSFIGISSYRLSTEALYGKDLKRIDEIIEELSESSAS